MQKRKEQYNNIRHASRNFSGQERFFGLKAPQQAFYLQHTRDPAGNFFSRFFFWILLNLHFK